MSQKQKKHASRKSTKRVRATPLDGSEEISPPGLDAPVLPAGSQAEDAPLKLGRKAYEAELAKLQAELVAMQEWVTASGAKVCVVFEGRDTAGAGVERVMGFCTPEETQKFLDQVPAVEKAMVDTGIILVKYWLEVSEGEQTRRLESRMHDPRKGWKLTDMDLKSYSRWYDYSRARDAMFAATDTPWAPWHIARTDDKKRGRLNIISHLLTQVPYEPIPDRDVALPKRQKPGGYRDPGLQLHHIPTPF